jgi:DNA polymerase-3 subunit delta'
VEVVSLEAQAAVADKPTRATTLTIETVRAMRSSAALLPLESARRIVIVDDAETLLEPAQQALLKTLEEPPAAVTFILLCDERDALLDTVRSRCREVALRPATTTKVEAALRRAGLEDERARDIASLSRGCTAWALAAATDARLLAARQDERERAISWIGAARYERLVTAFKLGEQFGARRDEVLGIVQAAAQVLREEMLRAASSQESRPADSLFAADVSPRSIAEAVAASLQCLADLDANVRPRLAMEAMVLAWPSSGWHRS